MAINYQVRIARDPGVCGGEPVIKGTRVTLRTILASLAEGATGKEILEDFPTLTEEDVRAVILNSRLAQVGRRVSRKSLAPVGVFAEGDTPEGVSDLTGNPLDARLGWRRGRRFERGPA